jgi:hypothetical protein
MVRGEEKEVGIVNANTTLFYIPEHKMGKTISSTPCGSDCSDHVPCS